MSEERLEGITEACGWRKSRGRSQCKGCGAGTGLGCPSVNRVRAGQEPWVFRAGLSAGFALHPASGNAFAFSASIHVPLPFLFQGPRAGSTSSPSRAQVNRQQVCSSGSVAGSDLSLHYGGDVSLPSTF